MIHVYYFMQRYRQAYIKRSFISHVDYYYYIYCVPKKVVDWEFREQERHFKVKYCVIL